MQKAGNDSGPSYKERWRNYSFALTAFTSAALTGAPVLPKLLYT